MNMRKEGRARGREEKDQGMVDASGRTISGVKAAGDVPCVNWQDGNF
jgi:hypothetical protein